MKYFLPTLLLVLFSQSIFSQNATSQFELNNIRWHQNTDGRMFYSGTDPFIGMEIPINSGIAPMYTSSLWIGGTGPDGNVNFTGQNYCLGGCSYVPGPLKTDGTAQTDDATIAAFDRFWSVSQSEIDLHLAYFNCINDSDCDENIAFPDGYDIPEAFLTWPAEGDVENGYASNLAPFFDYNDDGTYNPEDGDHPVILGDFSSFCILNGSDPSNIATSIPTGFEVHLTVYGFEAIEGAEFNSLFVQYKVINRADESYNDTYFGVFNDFDLGNPTDDYLGTEVSRSTVYVYNGSDFDAPSSSSPGYGDDLPVFGMRILGGPLQDADGADNPSISDETDTYGNQTTGWGDGIADNERLGLAHSIYMSNSGPNPTQDPQIYIEFNTYMQSIWRDGSPLTYGGNGYNPQDEDAINARYVFPGLSDPLFSGTDGVDPNYPNEAGWTEETEGLLPGDRRSLCSSGPFTFNSGDVQYFDMVYVFARDSDFPGEDPFDGFIDYLDEIADLPWGEQIPDIVTSVKDVSAENLGISLYPNPASNVVMLESQNHNRGHYAILNLIGQVVMQGNTTGNRTAISISELPKGMYLLRYEVAGKAATEKLVVE